MERMEPGGGDYSRPQQFLDGGIYRSASAEEWNQSMTTMSGTDCLAHPLNQSPDHDSEKGWLANFAFRGVRPRGTPMINRSSSKSVKLIFIFPPTCSTVPTTIRRSLGPRRYIRIM
jgi:hypothetical protein